MEKRILKGKRVFGGWLLGMFTFIPISSLVLAYKGFYLESVLVMLFFLPIIIARKRIVLDFVNKEIHFHTGWFFYVRKHKASKYERCKIKLVFDSYGDNNTILERTYSIVNKGLYIADIINKEEKLIKVGNQKELEEIAKELEAHFGIIRV